MAEQTPDGPAGGLTEYVNRSRAGHKRLPDGWCSCDKPLCPQRFLLDHIDDLIKAYQLKVQDLARETARNSVHLGRDLGAIHRDEIARLALEAALAGRTPVELPEPDEVARNEGDPGKGSAYWRTSAARPARAAVIVSRGVTERPILMIDGLIWDIAETRALAGVFLAAALYAERLSGGSQVGDQ